MKRDMDLIRKILFHLESREEHKAVLELPIEGFDRTTIMYHMLLLAQARLVDFEPEVTENGRIIRAHVLGLNWSGHEFLDAIRSETVWRKLVAYTKEKGGALPYEVLKALGIQILQSAFTS